MDLCSSYSVWDVLEEIIQWRARKEMIPHQLKLRWNQFHLSVVRSYVYNSGLDSDSRLQSIAKLLNGTLWNESSTVFLKMVASFTQLLHQFFIVPTQQCQLLNNLNRNELLAGFIHFLVLLPYYYEGEISDPFKDRMVSLENRLRFLLILLGDTLFVDDEHEQVKNLLAQVESVANKVGKFLHSFFFSRTRSELGLDEGFDSTFKQMDLFNDDIIKFLDLLPSINKAPPLTSIVDSPLIDFLIYDLEDLLNLYDSMISDDHLKDQVNILLEELIVLQSFTMDTWSPQPSETEEPKKSPVGIPDEAHHAQYLIKSYLVGDVPLWYFSISLSQFTHRIKLIRIQLQEIKMKSKATESLQGESNSEEDANEVTVGSEEKELEILDQLLGGEVKRQIICIYGMPGIGKTTLAKKLYNHPSVNYRFDKLSWCVVSQMYDKNNAMTELLISLLTSKVKKSMTLNMQESDLVENIYKNLMGRRYLIVLDDIWSPDVWDDLRSCFPDNGNGSRIMFTSRNEDVAPPPPDSIIHRLPFLSDEQCWELLQKKVFCNERCPHELLGIGKKIANRCCGLPLSVVVIAGVLSSMDKEKTIWNKVAVSLTSYIFSDQNNHAMQILKLSFNQLPAHLKLCFLYFQRFQTYKEICVQEVIRLWIAEGFIRKEEKKSLESSAEESLMKLIDKSIVMVAKRSSDGRVKTCLLHDLLRDLCSNICSEVNFLNCVESEDLFYVRGYNRPLSFQHSSSPTRQHVRSFQGYLPESQFNVDNLKFLRVLNHEVDHMHALVGSGHFLVQLRYLVVTCLDACLGSLVNLEYLRVENEAKSDDDDHKEDRIKQKDGNVSDDDDYNNEDSNKQKDNGGVQIPFVILTMVKLRDLYMKNIAASFDKDCESSQTNNLKLLSNVVIRSFSDEEILRCSPHLRKLKCICETFQLEETGAYQYPDFSFFTQLESLNMTTHSERRMADISLPLSLKKLTLSKLSLPWEKMSVIGGLPNLQVLKLLKNAFCGEIWETKEDEFQELTFLKLEDLDLVEWNVGHSQHFRKLRQLVLIRCKNLQEIPFEIGEIVQLIELTGCTDSVWESAQQIQQEQEDIGNEELRVVITNKETQSMELLELKRLKKELERLELLDLDRLEKEDHTYLLSIRARVHVLSQVYQ